MKKKEKEKYYKIWSIWILILGIIMILFIVIPGITSIGDYFNAFLINRPELSWCPTLLTIYGILMLLGYKKVGYAAGIVLLPLGIIVTITGLMYQMNEIFPHIVHFSELITGILTVYQIREKYYV